MQPHEIADRLTILYGNKHPIVNSLERVVNTEELSSIFVLSSYLLGKEHRETISALKNLVYERKPDDNIFVLFKVINAIREDDEALHALRNLCSSSEVNMPVLFRVIHCIEADHTDHIALNALQNVVDSDDFVQLQTELLFKLIINLSDTSETVLSAIKNMISSKAEPDLFLLFKVIQAIDPNNQWIGTLKSATLYKTNIPKLAHRLTEEKYTLPINMGKMLKRFEGQALTDAFSRGQLRSKLWVSDTINSLDLDLGKMVYVCAGWYGVLPAILFERNDVQNILSIDSDPSTDNPADTLNKEQTIDNGRFKAIVKDIKLLKYYSDNFEAIHYQYSSNTEFETTTIQQFAPEKITTCVINTSCEHIENFEHWWREVPKGMLVIMQNNDFDDEAHEHAEGTVNSLEEFKEKLNLSETLYEGELALEEYNRYMLIGHK